MASINEDFDPCDLSDFGDAFKTRTATTSAAEAVTGTSDGGAKENSRNPVNSLNCNA